MTNPGKCRDLARRTAAVVATAATTCSVALMTASASHAAPITSGAVLSGQVLGAGRAVSGTSVTLIAWPNAATLGRLA